MYNKCIEISLLVIKISNYEYVQGNKNNNIVWCKYDK